MAEGHRTVGRLAGKVAIVTGGSRGIGREIVRRFRLEGGLVAFTFNSSPESAEVIVGELGQDATVGVKCDVTDELQIAALMDSVTERWGKIDILVNNAGITRDGLMLRMSREDFEDVITTNLTSAFLATKAVLRPMMSARSGRIINISSVVGLVGNPGQANYVASKAGLVGMTKSIAREIASRNILVNCIAPGYIQSDMTDRLNDRQREAIIGAIPLGRVGQAADVAAMAVFLASDDAAYITGQVFPVDGGMTMGG